MSSSQNSRVIDPEGISYAVTNGHKDGEPKIIEPIGCAMRGRNPENPSERGRSNGKYKQRIEMGSNIRNTITSVQKDSLVSEPNRDTDGCIQVGNIYPDLENMPNRSGGRVYSKEGCSPTILSRDFKTPKLVAEPNEDKAKTLCLNSKVDGKQPSLEHRIYDAEGISTAITTGFLPNIKESTSYRIRKLTPRECFRLMGVEDKDIDTIQASGVSNSQQYKMAGNSIVVDCLYHLFRKMFTETQSEDIQLTLF